MDNFECDDTGCLDTVFNSQHHRLAELRRTDCQWRKVKILQSLMSLDDIIKNQVQKTSVKDDGINNDEKTEIFHSKFYVYFS